MIDSFIDCCEYGNNNPKEFIDEWENGETIYYFIGRDKSILQ